MAKKVTKQKSPVKTAGASDSRRYELIGLFLFAAGVLTLLSLLGFNVGFLGRAIKAFISYMFGVGVYLVPLFIMVFGIGYIVRKSSLIISKRLVGMIFIYVFFLALFQHFNAAPGQEIMPDHLADGGGLIGGFILFLLRKLFGSDGTLVVLLTLELSAVLITTKWSLAKGIIKTREHTEQGVRAAKKTLTATYEKVREAELFKPETTPTELPSDPYKIPSRRESFYDQAEDGAELSDSAGGAATAGSAENLAAELESVAISAERLTAAAAVEEQAEPDEPEAAAEPEEIPVQYAFADAADESMEDTLEIEPSAMQAAIAETAGAAASDEAGEPESEPKQAAALQPKQPPAVQQPAIKAAASDDKLAEPPLREYIVPRIEDILEKPEKKGNSQVKKEIAENARVIEKTLESFHVKAKIVNACHGPAVTRYELELAPGIKVSKIVGLADDLALSLAASGIRIEAPIPGKAAVGIEVPNHELSGVHLREVLEQPEFAAQPSRMTVGLGMDISGRAILADIGKMPHVLVAGATGSGKSVCINTLITSILFKAKPDEVKFILIDPKMVELSNYNGIPHLMVPVVVDSMKASSVLKWAVQEMEKRYAKFAAAGVRDMGRYNKAQADGGEKMPAVIIIIDELADLMMVAAKDVEDSICRLAQKARAAGIHLVLATQRPSVDIITGVIKANIPSRISFAVSSQIDSRTILDAPGAEKLLGKGDMLYYPSGMAKPLRVQGAFISDDEVARLIDYVKAQGEPEENEEIISFTENDLKDEASMAEDGDFEDECMGAALRLVLDVGSASASFLQRRLHVGYNRGARLVEQMEEMKIVGPANGSKPRELLISREQLAQLIEEKYS